MLNDQSQRIKLAHYSPAESVYIRIIHTYIHIYTKTNCGSRRWSHVLSEAVIQGYTRGAFELLSSPHTISRCFYSLLFLFQIGELYMALCTSTLELFSKHVLFNFGV